MKVIEEEEDFEGEKPIRNGFIVKSQVNKATIVYNDGEYIYALKVIRTKKGWKVIGVPSMWKDLNEIVNI